MIMDNVLIWPSYAVIMLRTMSFIAGTEWQMKYISYVLPFIVDCINNFPLFSTNWDHSLQSVWWQIQWSSLWRHHMWRMQGKMTKNKYFLKISKFHPILGFLPSFPVQRDQLPVSETEELRGGQSQQKPVSVLQVAEVYAVGDVQRWWVQYNCYHVAVQTIAIIGGGNFIANCLVNYNK